VGNFASYRGFNFIDAEESKGFREKKEKGFLKDPERKRERQSYANHSAYAKAQLEKKKGGGGKNKRNKI